MATTNQSDNTQQSKMDEKKDVPVEEKTFDPDAWWFTDIVDWFKQLPFIAYLLKVLQQNNSAFFLVFMSVLSAIIFGMIVGWVLVKYSIWQLKPQEVVPFPDFSIFIPPRATPLVDETNVSTFLFFRDTHSSFASAIETCHFHGSELIDFKSLDLLDDIRCYLRSENNVDAMKMILFVGETVHVGGPGDNMKGLSWWSSDNAANETFPSTDEEKASFNATFEKKQSFIFCKSMQLLPGKLGTSNETSIKKDEMEWYLQQNMNTTSINPVVLIFGDYGRVNDGDLGWTGCAHPLFREAERRTTQANIICVKEMTYIEAKLQGIEKKTPMESATCDPREGGPDLLSLQIKTQSKNDTSLK